MPSVAYELARCHVCGGTDTDEVADADEVRAEVEALWSFHTRRVAGETPPDKLLDRAAFSEPPPVRVVRCRNCGLVYRNPQERAEDVAGIYEADAGVGDDVLRTLFANQRRSYRMQARRLTRIATVPGMGLEVGSYVGAFLDAARDRGWRFEGVDVNEGASRFARRQGLTVTVGTIDALPATRRFDAVAIWNCLDQLPDPRHVIRRARSLLSPGGIVAVRVPNGGVYARWREAAEHGPASPIARAILAHNNLLTFPYRYGFTLQSLRRLLRDSGLRVLRVYGDTLVPVADEHTRSWARVEERAVKGALRALRTLRLTPASASPWLEVYARARQ
ncbi:MAG: methyltransferase domain-containing protein [Gemmatimonadaceae bacterium]